VTSMVLGACHTSTCVLCGLPKGLVVIRVPKWTTHSRKGLPNRGATRWYRQQSIAGKRHAGNG